VADAVSAIHILQIEDLAVGMRRILIGLIAISHTTQQLTASINHAINQYIYITGVSAFQH